MRENRTSGSVRGAPGNRRPYRSNGRKPAFRTMYESLILVDPDTDISTEQVASELRDFYKGDASAPHEIKVHGQTISLCWPDYSIEICREAQPHVLDESAELAEQYAAQHPDRERISRCTCRFSTHAEDDEDLAHFNDYLFVGEAIARLGKVYRFDQSSAEFWE